MQRQDERGYCCQPGCALSVRQSACPSCRLSVLPPASHAETDPDSATRSPAAVGVLNALVVVMETQEVDAGGMRAEASNSMDMVAGAILSAVSARPLVSQRYKVRVAVGAGQTKTPTVCKKISYTNTYSERRIFRFRTNCPEVMVVA